MSDINQVLLSNIFKIKEIPKNMIKNNRMETMIWITSVNIAASLTYMHNSHRLYFISDHKKSKDFRLSLLHHDYINLFLIKWIERSEEHTSELQSRGQLVCRLLL